MKVTYLNHSGFLLEWTHSYWIFDYFKGTIPPLDPQKDIFVFCSHSHGDHFNPLIFKLLKDYPAVTYIFSAEIRTSFEKLEIHSEQQTIYFLEDRTDISLLTSSNESIQIHTLKSTDLGCAFFILFNGRTIYHAGDLHWWHWEGEPDDWNDQITKDYKNEMHFLNGKSIDLAFNLLDPRQKQDYALGMNYFLKNTHTKHVFPMHFWNDFSIISCYLKEHFVHGETTFYAIAQDGQTFEIMI